jgi:hypothetical protein
MKKKQNINMLIGGVMYRGIEKMDDMQLNKVALALLGEVKSIERAIQGNISQAKAAELMAKGKKLMQRLQQVEQFKRNWEARTKAGNHGQAAASAPGA